MSSNTFAGYERIGYTFQRGFTCRACGERAVWYRNPYGTWVAFNAGDTTAEPIAHRTTCKPTPKLIPNTQEQAL